MAKRKKKKKITKKATASLATSRVFKNAMREFGNGKLRSSDGKVVTNIEQARAIAFSKARRARS